MNLSAVDEVDRSNMEETSMGMSQNPNRFLDNIDVTGETEVFGREEQKVNSSSFMTINLKDSELNPLSLSDLGHHIPAPDFGKAMSATALGQDHGFKPVRKTDIFDSMILAKKKSGEGSGGGVSAITFE